MTEDQVIEMFSRGDTHQAIESARESGLTELAKKFEESLLFCSSVESYRSHYEEDNGRQAGQQLTENWGPDSRQITAMNHIQLLGAQSMLDVGCSDGSFSFFCLARGLVQDVVGVEPWGPGVDWANKYAAEKFPGKAVFIKGLLEDVEQTRSFDVAFLGEVLEHVLDPVSILKKCKIAKAVVVTIPIQRAAITPKEKAILTGGAPAEHIRFVDETAIGQYCTAAGFVVSRVDRVGQGLGWVNLIATFNRIEDSACSIP